VAAHRAAVPPEPPTNGRSVLMSEVASQLLEAGLCRRFQLREVALRIAVVPELFLEDGVDRAVAIGAWSAVKRSLIVLRPA
jgi:hypothetical protein